MTVQVGELFREAIRANAAILLVHNHPMRAVREAGKLLDIEVLDHIVIGTGGHVSLRERGSDSRPASK